MERDDLEKLMGSDSSVFGGVDTSIKVRLNPKDGQYVVMWPNKGWGAVLTPEEASQMFQQLKEALGEE